MHCFLLSFMHSLFPSVQIVKSKCLKKAGMSIKSIKTYITLAMEGDSTIEERLSMFINQKKTLQKQIDDLEKTMHVLDYKCWYYETAKEKGSVEKVKNIPDEDVPEQFKEIRKELKAIKDGLN